jgi:hypothetical protein
MPGGWSRNKLIVFEDGTYLELYDIIGLQSRRTGGSGYLETVP